MSQIKDAIARLHEKLLLVDPLNLNISEYNQVYFKKYINNYTFYMSLYSQLLHKAIQKLDKPIEDSVFVDYGGGCGILSFLAKEIGFKSVVYSDIYSVSVTDSMKISQELNYEIDHFICGDVCTFVNQIATQGINPDLICSFDVLEHIYDLEKWVKTIASINESFLFVFMTSANPCNPFVSRRLKRIQIRAEYQGSKKNVGWKENDLTRAFCKERELIIRNSFPSLKIAEIELLSTKTRGLRIDDIKTVVESYMESGIIDCEIIHSTNTCDPYTGNWTEHLIDLSQLKKIMSDNSFDVDVTNSYYGYSNKKILNIPKFGLNLLIRLFGQKNLMFSPTYTIEARKR